MRYLAHPSALVRLLREQVLPVWDDLTERGLVAVCEPVVAEALRIADPKHCQWLEEEVERVFVGVPVPDDVWTHVAAVRRALAPHQALSVADLVVAATAIRLGLTVLHDDASFEAAARLVPELRQQPVWVGP